MFGVISAAAETSVPLHSELSLPQELKRYMQLGGGSFLLQAGASHCLMCKGVQLRSINISSYFSRDNRNKQKYPESLICMLGVQLCQILS